MRHEQGRVKQCPVLCAPPSTARHGANRSPCLLVNLLGSTAAPSWEVPPPQAQQTCRADQLLAPSLLQKRLGVRTPLRLARPHWHQKHQSKYFRPRSPSWFSNTCPARTGRRPSTFKPTRTRCVPSRICWSRMSAPGYPPARSPPSRLEGAIAHLSPASIGVISSDNS